VEFLLVACILSVGLLGLGALQVATVRALGGTWTRLAAATLAENALEGITADAGRGLPTRPGPWVQRFDRDGRPTAARSAFFTVTVTRSAAGSPAPAWAYQAAATWVGAPGSGPGSIILARLVLQ
jgi:hypothetical protein